MSWQCASRFPRGLLETPTMLVYLRDRERGAAGILPMPATLGADGVFNTWIWSDGNYSCDCNRRRLLDRVLGGEPARGVRSRCSDGRIAVDAILLHGVVVYRDDELLTFNTGGGR